MVTVKIRRADCIVFKDNDGWVIGPKEARAEVDAGKPMDFYDPVHSESDLELFIRQQPLDDRTGEACGPDACRKSPSMSFFSVLILSKARAEAVDASTHKSIVSELERL
jgi:hypothetical protein